MKAVKRILVMGNSGSGKTSFAQQLAQRLGIQHVELDAIHWLPDWQMRSLEDFRNRVGEIAGMDSWVIDGNYTKSRDLVMERVEQVIFLDLPLPISLWRILKRSINRAIRQEKLWSGNQESLRTLFFSRDSLLYFATRTWRRRRRQFFKLEKNPQFGQISFLRFRTQREIEAYLRSF